MPDVHLLIQFTKYTSVAMRTGRTFVGPVTPIAISPATAVASIARLYLLLLHLSAHFLLSGLDFMFQRGASAPL